MRSTYDGSSVFIPCSTCTNSASSWSSGDDRVAPVEAEAAVVLLDVARPDLLAAEVERLEDAGAGHHPDVPAVGDRRRRRHVLLALLVVAAAERALPDGCAFGAIHRPEVTGRAPCRRRSGRCARPRRSASIPTTPAAASFQVMFSVVDHSHRQIRSRALTPFTDGPRHGGQFSAYAGADPSASRSRTIRIISMALSDTALMRFG